MVTVAQQFSTHKHSNSKRSDRRFTSTRLPASIRVGSCSETGEHRSANEDRCYADSTAGILLVVDGMGGYRGGELASRMLARIIPRELWQIHDDPVQSAESIAVAIRRCVVAANAAMIQLAVREESLRRMGATMVLGFLHNRTLYLTHYGDCRAYLVRSGRMCQLTTDQTFVQVLVEAGVITKEKARSHPQRHVVLNGVTAKEPVQAPEVAMVNLSRGDRLLFCSDGLWSAVDDEMLAQILESTADPQRAAKRLVSEALENDTWDNATCIVAHVDVQAMSRNVVNRPGQFIPWHDAA